MWSMTFEFSNASDLIRLIAERFTFSSAIRNSGMPANARHARKCFVLSLGMVVSEVLKAYPNYCQVTLPRYNFIWREDHDFQGELPQSHRRGRKRRRTRDRRVLGALAERVGPGGYHGHQAIETRCAYPGGPRRSAFSHGGWTRHRQSSAHSASSDRAHADGNFRHGMVQSPR